MRLAVVRLAGVAAGRRLVVVVVRVRVVVGRALRTGT
jgi:hypothetical protein